MPGGYLENPMQQVFRCICKQYHGVISALAWTLQGFRTSLLNIAGDASKAVCLLGVTIDHHIPCDPSSCTGSQTRFSDSSLKVHVQTHESVCFCKAHEIMV